MGINVLITGVADYLGSVLATHLASILEIVKIMGVEITSPPSSLPDKVSFNKLDIRSPELADAKHSEVNSSYLFWAPCLMRSPL
jgi:nucleoside-diphosphate-sugar epimerase